MKGSFRYMCNDFKCNQILYHTIYQIFLGLKNDQMMTIKRMSDQVAWNMVCEFVNLTQASNVAGATIMLSMS